MPKEDAEVNEAKEFAKDIDTFVESIKELEGKMTSVAGEYMISLFLENTVPRMKFIKAEMLIKVGLM